MANFGNYAGNPKTAVAVVSTANSARDGTGTMATLVTGATRNLAADPPLAGGTRIDGIALSAAGATTQGMLRLFLHDGANARLLAEIEVGPVTPSTTVRPWSARLTRESCDFMPIVLAPGASLRISTQQSEAFHAVVFNGGDF